MNHDPNCIFCKIIAGKIPAKKLYEDDDVLAFHDINPAAPVHFLIIPKIHIATLNDTTAENTALLGKMLLLAPTLAKQAGAENGFRTVINTGLDGGQEVYHVHMHVMGGARPWKRAVNERAGTQ
jgi:histidine triad (HIT) family protein